MLCNGNMGNFRLSFFRDLSLENDHPLELYSAAPWFDDDLDGCICCKVSKIDQYLEIS